MRRAAITGGVVLACCFGTQRAHAECEPGVVVADGDATAIEVRDELSARGLGAGHDDSCPAVHATVTRDAAGLAIDLVDTSGRTSHRSVATVSEAVTVIESWARSELTTDLLSGFEVPATDAAPPLAPLAAPADAPTVAVVARPSRARDPLSGSMTGDVAVDANATRWIGITATTCVRLRWFCVGGTGHLRTAASFEQSDTALLATLELPLALAHVAWTPGVAAGIGRRMWNTTSGEDQEQGASIDARLEARVTFSYSLGRRIFLDAVGAAEALLTDEQHEGDTSDARSPIAIFRIGAGLRIGAL